MSKASKQLASVGLRELDLKLREYYHEVPDVMDIEMMIVYKDKNQPNEFINPLLAFAIKDGILRVINRRNSSFTYLREVKTIRRVVLVPMEHDAN